jgi:hypothetical protein
VVVDVGQSISHLCGRVRLGMVAWWVHLELVVRVEVEVSSVLLGHAHESRQSDGHHLQSVDPYSSTQCFNYGIQVLDGLGWEGVVNYKVFKTISHLRV